MGIKWIVPIATKLSLIYLESQLWFYLQQVERDLSYENGKLYDLRSYRATEFPYDDVNLILQCTKVLLLLLLHWRRFVLQCASPLRSRTCVQVEELTSRKQKSSAIDSIYENLSAEGSQLYLPLVA